MTERTARGHESYTPESRNISTHFWVMVHPGKPTPTVCGYCGGPADEHGVGDYQAIRDVPRAWRLPLSLRKQPTVLYNIDRAAAEGTSQIVCFAIPMKES